MPAMRLIPVTLLLMAIGIGSADAADVTARDAWIRLLPGNLPAAGYLELDNNGVNSVQLVGMQSARFGAIELHLSSEQSGVARMRQVHKLVIPAGKMVELKPRGYHLMLFRSTGDLQPGGQVTVTLEFSDGSYLPVNFMLRDATGQ